MTVKGSRQPKKTAGAPGLSVRVRRATAVLAGLLLSVSAAAQDKAPLDLVQELCSAYSVQASAARIIDWLGKGGNPDIVLDGGERNTFVHHAAPNLPRILAEAVRRGGDCHRRKNAHGATPLHFAAAQDMGGWPRDPRGAEAVRILVQCGADPNALHQGSRLHPGFDGSTPLHIIYAGVAQGVGGAFAASGKAGGERRFDILTVLLAETKADPNISNVEGDAPVMLLIRDRGSHYPSKQEHLSLFLEHGAGLRNVPAAADHENPPRGEPGTYRFSSNGRRFAEPEPGGLPPRRAASPRIRFDGRT